MYLLDTNACIRILNDTSTILVERLKREIPATLFVSAITKAELTYGAYFSNRTAANLQKIERFINPYSSLPFDDTCVGEYGRLRAELRRLGKPVGTNDMLIAAIALANNLTLITANIREFSRVPELRFENWEV